MLCLALICSLVWIAVLPLQTNSYPGLPPQLVFFFFFFFFFNMSSNEPLSVAELLHKFNYHFQISVFF